MDNTDKEILLTIGFSSLVIIFLIELFITNILITINYWCILVIIIGIILTI